MLTAEIIHGFSSSLLQKSFDAPVTSPACHFEWWEAFCDTNPKVAIAAPRRHAKTTAITQTCTLASVLFRERSYVLIVSDTITQAVQFLGEIKKELLDNDQLRTLFKVKGFIKETEDDFICECEDGHKFRISAKGSEQKVRGLKWDGKRPDLIICDDLENDEIVMNKERRDKFKRWFYGALLPCMSKAGIIRYVGTILHNDSMLESLMPKYSDKYTVHLPLKTYSTRPNPGWLSFKYRAHTPDFEHILWPENYTKEWFIATRADFIDKGIPDVYSQEYLNQPLDESVAFFKRSDLIPIKEADRKTKLNYYITADLAISEEERADYSVFIIAGVDENKLLHIKNVIRERLDGREIVDTLLALQRSYDPVAIGIEEMQVSKSIGPFLREEMIRSNTFATLIKLKHGGKDKPTRARSIQARLRAKTILVDQQADWYPAFEDEIVTFPRGKHDDQVDAFAYLGLMLDNLIEAPTKEEQEESEYLEELTNSGAMETGRSETTGY